MTRLLPGLVAVACLMSVVPVVAQQEWRRMISLLHTPPPLKAEPGFTIRALVRPGDLYDPHFIIPRGVAGAWVTDDGGLERESGGAKRLVTVSDSGAVSVVTVSGSLHPIVAGDIAPSGFGSFGGQMFVVGDAEAAAVVQRIDPARGNVVADVCTLPMGAVPADAPRRGYEARFGPAGSPFSGRLFVVATGGDAIYQVTPEGACTPFARFDGNTLARPLGLLFAADGQSMLVSAVSPAASVQAAGVVVRVAPDGTVDPRLVTEALRRPSGLALAPQGFGAYGGQLFVADYDNLERPLPQNHRLKPDGRLYRVDTDGARRPVASGFINPVGVRFVGGALWVSDINGDFMSGRELPDGFIAEIRPR